MNNKRLLIKLWYKDQTYRDILLAIPDKMADEIAQKGLIFAQVFVQEKIQIPVTKDIHLDNYKGG